MTVVADRRETCQVGRRARLELVFARKAGKTILAHAYVEPPLRAAGCFERGDALHMILASSAPGLFGGDEFQQSIVVEEGARVRLASQSAAQLHPSVDGVVARVRSAFRVASSADLQCDWDPLIPFAGAALDQRIDIDLAADARLFWSDALMNGRSGRGEEWLFRSLAHELRVSRAGTLEYLERFHLAPAAQALDQIWIGGDSQYFSTVLASGTPVSHVRVEDLHNALGAIDDVRAAADTLNEKLLVVRLMSRSGARFHEARTLIRGWRT